MRLHGRLAEFGDVRSGDEGAARAEQDHGLDLRIGVEMIRRRPEPLTQTLGQGVDRRVIHDDDADLALAPDADDAHAHVQIPR